MQSVLLSQEESYVSAPFGLLLLRFNAARRRRLSIGDRVRLAENGSMQLMESGRVIREQTCDEQNQSSPSPRERVALAPREVQTPCLQLQRKQTFQRAAAGGLGIITSRTFASLLNDWQNKADRLPTYMAKYQSPCLTC
jgi:hypothetical protein